MKNTLRLLLLGIITWLVPFVIAFFFMDKTGELVVDVYFFKTIMIITGGIIGAFAIAFYFKKANSMYLKYGVLSGAVWFLLNIVLDILVLLPMSKMPYGEYFTQIGLRYLMIPIMCILTGYLLDYKIIKS